nr:hypothetical protein [Tanacetum cinerariifolium]
MINNEDDGGGGGGGGGDDGPAWLFKYIHGGDDGGLARLIRKTHHLTRRIG